MYSRVALAITAVFLLKGDDCGSFSSNGVTVQVLGPGMVTGIANDAAGGDTKAEFDCNQDCGAQTERLVGNQIVALTATPVAGSIFAGWSGYCSGTEADFEIVLGSTRVDITCTATFETLESPGCQTSFECIATCTQFCTPDPNPYCENSSGPGTCYCNGKACE